MSFRNRLTLLLVIALVAVQAATAFIAYSYLRTNLVDKGKRDLLAASDVFMRQLNLVSDRVTDGVTVLSLDYALRQAIGQEDRGTELSALRNHGHRIGATRMMLVGLDGKLSADTGAKGAGQPFPFPNVLGDAIERDRGTAMATLDGAVYWIVVVPVRAPLPIAFVAACIPINNTMLEKFRTLGTNTRSLALAVKNGGNWHLVAQSNNHPRNMPLPAITQGAGLVQIDGSDWLTIAAPLATAENSAPVAVVMGYPLQVALSEFQSLVWPMLAIFAVALVLSLAGSTVIVGGMARPLETLAVRARRIAAGDYTTEPLKIGEDHELGQLSNALTNMTHAISDREAALTDALTSVESARNEAVQANLAKSQFLANMSHELRTPLNAIVGFSEMLGSQVLGPLGKQRYVEYANDISGSGQHLLGMVSRMLDLADAENGRLKIMEETFALAPVIERAVVRFLPLAEKNNVMLAGPDSTKGWPTIAGDAAKLEQAIGGIIHNAIKFTPAGGHVDITGVRRDDRFALFIADSGIGMEPDHAALVVRPFQRLRSALDGAQQGAGLGLSFAKAITEAHLGNLRIDSTVGVGTRVELEFPVHAAAKGTQAA
jgi:signal transduction histidine kinase